MSNFTFLNSWQTLHENATQAENTIYSDPRTSCFYARRTLEKVVEWLYRYDVNLKQPYDTNLAALIHEASFKKLLGAGLFPKIKAIQKLGNQAVHSNSLITELDALQIIKELHHVLYWFYRNYSQQSPLINYEFDSNLIPKKVSIDANIALQSAKKLTELSKQLAEQDKLKADIDAKNAALSEELQTLRAEIAAQKLLNQQIKDTHDYNEADTRKFLIDQQLKEVGWNLSEPNIIEYEVKGMPNNQGIGFVDYVLWGENGLPLAVVEAKRTMYDATKGRQQAKLYADCLEKQFNQRPLIYFTNGYDIYFWDDNYYPERIVQGYYQRDELQRLINRRTERKYLLTVSINKDIAGRYYQEQAIRHICELFEQKKQRKALLVMATGTGKTRTIIALVDLLLKTGWIKRALFLADRNALVTQAKNEFTRLLPHSSPIILNSGLTNVNNRVCFSTYPTMMNLLNEPADNRLFSVGFFDLVIVDEAHRSVYKKYRYIFDYFDALLVGLTATPKADIDKNTYSIFDLESGVPTYAYESEQAYNDGYLVPPVCMSVPTKFMRNGIHYKDLSTDEQEQWEEKTELEDREQVLSSELNTFLFNADTVDKVLAHLMTNGIKVEGGDKLGKTIIFAANNDHAQFIYKRFNANYPSYAGHFARVITYKENYPETLIAEFKDNQSKLTIAISVDMLDTGIDVPEVVNLVFFKVVKSKVKFLQMVGRGTRLCPKLFGIEDKQNFKIFDFCQNLEYFELNPDGANDNKQKSLSEAIFEKRLKLATELYSVNNEHKKLIEFRDYTLSLLHHHVSGMNLDNFIVRPKRQYVEQFTQREMWNTLDKNQVSEIFNHITKLPSEADAFNNDEINDELSKRFDHLILQIQLEYLKNKKLPESLRLTVVDIASHLETKSSVPNVAKHLTLIQEIQTDEYWQYITLPMLEEIRKKLRGLIQFIDAKDKQPVYTNFNDEIGEADEKHVEIIYNPNNLVQYRKKVESYIKSHEDQLTIHKLKRNIPITVRDLEVLEDILFQISGIPSKEDYIKTITDTKQLGVFVRELVGLDRAAAKEAFAEFLDETIYNATQIHFINCIIDYLTVNGIMDAGALFNPQFTAIHDDSVYGFFEETQVIRIVDKLKSININSSIDNVANF